MFQSAFAVRIEEMYLAVPTTKSAMRLTSEFKFFLSGRGSNIQLQDSSKQFLPPMWFITFHHMIYLYWYLLVPNVLVPGSLQIQIHQVWTMMQYDVNVEYD